MKTYTTDELSIHFNDLISLYQEGKLRLGIDNLLAAQIANTSGLGPTKTTATTALHFWSWVALGILAVSIYYSLASNWWWFILGLIGMRTVWKANKKGTRENYLSAAFVDQDFYERIAALNGWLYKIDEETAAHYQRQPNSISERTDV